MAAKTNKKAKPVKKKKPTKAQLKKIEQAKAKAKRISDRHDKAMKVIDLIETGKSLRFALIKNSMSAETFYKWRAYLTKEDEEEGSFVGDNYNAKRYARACEERERIIFEEMIDIADDCTGDKKEFVNGRGEVVEVEDREFTSRSKLKIETRQWILGKMRPEKYGNNVQVKTEQDITISFK